MKGNLTKTTKHVAMVLQLVLKNQNVNGKEHFRMIYLMGFVGANFMWLGGIIGTYSIGHKIFESEYYQGVLHGKRTMYNPE